ncbi:uracil-DNA glycosylase [Litoreibacter roseus]|uniref:Type-4 uracil-DNA glycosylase n=1 Tax=Litoreibacter roseus TaxID=2601869 RepID=A0A6N6JEQ1_9RHOB|nr:uracil-DNA glycosylase [Litoreibacter roseus]GFE64831.1 uracil-DNA glycosylase [Litoreibacter roseus]
MVEELDFETARAMLEWQVDLGVTEAISEAPINRYDTPKAAPKVQPKPDVTQATQTDDPVDTVAVAREMAAGADDLEALHAAIAGFDYCDLKKGARSLVFADGQPTARVMIIGEAPGADEDRQGRPFVGRAGQLLDAMLSAIEFGRSSEANPVYITNILPWRPPQNRDPKPDEIAMMLPFVERHVALINPDVLVLMGNISCQALLGRKGITKLRGTWTEALGRPTLPMFHPAYLLRTSLAKRDAWHDLLLLRAKMKSL